MKCTTSTCLVTALLCVLLGLGLTGCAVSDAENGDAVPSAVELELRDEDSSYTGNVLSLVEGTVCKAELPVETVLVPTAEQKQIALSGRKQLRIDSISYCLADGERLSALFSNADMLNASDTLRVDASCSGSDLDDALGQEVLDRVAETFSLRKTGYSAISTESFLSPPSSSAFSALYFYPRVVRIQGHIIAADKTEESAITLEYPCVNLLGCLDGTYKAIAVQPGED